MSGRHGWVGEVVSVLMLAGWGGVAYVLLAFREAETSWPFLGAAAGGAVLVAVAGRLARP